MIDSIISKNEFILKGLSDNKTTIQILHIIHKSHLHSLKTIKTQTQHVHYNTRMRIRDFFNTIVHELVIVRDLTQCEYVRHDRYASIVLPKA